MALGTWHKQTKQSKNRNNVRLQFLWLYCVNQHQKLSWVYLSLQPPIKPHGSLVPLILRFLSYYSNQLRNYRLTCLFSLQISIMWGYSLRYCKPINKSPSIIYARAYRTLTNTDVATRSRESSLLFDLNVILLAILLNHMIQKPWKWLMGEIWKESRETS